MGKLFQLFGMVSAREMSDEIANLKPEQRVAEIEKIAGSAQTIGIYSPEEFQVSYRGESVTIKTGWNQYNAAFAVWALQKYGKSSLYGKTFRTNADGKTVDCPVLLDENPEEHRERKPRVKAEAE